MGLLPEDAETAVGNEPEGIELRDERQQLLPKLLGILPVRFGDIDRELSDRGLPVAELPHDGGRRVEVVDEICIVVVEDHPVTHVQLEDLGCLGGDVGRGNLKRLGGVLLVLRPSLQRVRGHRGIVPLVPMVGA